MNKYQEALNNLSDYIDIKGDLNGEDNISHFNKLNVETLQELIDNYSKIQQFDKAIFFNANGVVVNGISYEQLEKALDKACECLEDGYGNEYADYKYYKDLDTSIKIPESMDYKEWKEWLLNE